MILETFSMQFKKKNNSLLIFLILFFYPVLSFKIILSNTLLANDKTQATPAEIRTTVNQTPVTNNVTDFVDAPIVTNVSTDSNIEFRVLSLL